MVPISLRGNSVIEGCACVCIWVSPAPKPFQYVVYIYSTHRGRHVSAAACIRAVWQHMLGCEFGPIDGCVAGMPDNTWVALEEEAEEEDC